MQKIVINMHIILLNVERMNEKYTVKFTEVESTPQYKKKFCMKIGLLIHGFRIMVFLL
jgi:hypothetical protein